MTAVSQSYPNYLGGLNEQPDELKKPGQLSEALNVIPDPVIGLSRRPGFELITWKNADGTPYFNEDNPDPSDPNMDPRGTWFEMDLSNQVNTDFIYYGCAKQDGKIVIFNQDGEVQAVRYSDESVIPHQNYLYDDGVMEVTDDNGVLLQTVNTDTTTDNGYFKNTPETPLKYCVSKEHIIFTNPTEVPSLAEPNDIDTPSEEGGITPKDKYYSFLNLKILDVENYDYVFKVFTEGTTEYTTINNITVDSVTDLGDRYDEDTTLPLSVKGPWRFTLADGDEAAVVDVTFVGQVQQLKSSDGDGVRNEARYPTITAKLISGGKGFTEGQIFREVLAGDRVGPNLPDLTITLRIGGDSTVRTTNNKDVVPGDSETGLEGYKTRQILSDLRDKFVNEQIGNLKKAVIVGNGIYLENNTPFSISTEEIAVADVMNSQKIDDDAIPIVRVNSVAELPLECYAGFIVEVTNSFDGENNYYLQYKSESETKDVSLTKSDGYWEEIAKPYERYSPNSGTLPHMITVAREADQIRFAFVVTPLRYKPRSAGDANDNPSMFTSPTAISDINYYKNRLFFFTTNGTVISSKAGKIDDLFLETGITSSLIDPIDLVANSNQRVPLHGSAVINNGMVIFGDSEQYSLTTANDVLTSETASLTKIANYTFATVSTPIYLGTNLGFVSSGMTRFYEMTNIYDRGPVDINERSQQIQTQFGAGFNMPVSSREQSQVLIHKKYNLPIRALTALEQKPYRSMYMYRFRQENSQESSQTAWVRWELDQPICFVSMPRDDVFTVVSDGSKTKLYRMNSQVAQNTNLINITVPEYTDGYYTDDSGNIVDGAEFDTIIKFPTIYGRSSGANPVSDITANLTIHRLKMSTALIGVYNIIIERYGYDPYNILVEQTPADFFPASSPPDIAPGVSLTIPPLSGEVVQTVPVYTRNYNLNVTIKSNYNAPLTLRSMTWEGDWNRPYYKSV